jgi:hypothetical protein
MKKQIHENKIYVIAITIVSIASGAAYGMPWLQDSQARLIESMHALSSDSNEYAKLLETLHSSVETELMQRFKKQEAELKQIEQRLKEAKSKLNQRKDKRFEIVERRVFDLLQKRDELDWASSTTNQNNAIVIPEGQAPIQQRTDTNIIDAQGDPFAWLSRVETQLVPNGTQPNNSTIKATDDVSTQTADTNPSASLGKESRFVTSAEASQITSAMNEALELEATIDTELGEAFANLSDFEKKVEVNFLSLPRRIRLLELKLEALEANKQTITSRLGLQVSLAESKQEVAKQELEISNELVKAHAEGPMEGRKKELELRVAKTLVTESILEAESYKSKMDDLAKRIKNVRKKYDGKFAAKYSKPSEALPDDK